jgi:hypothetical protein
VTTTTPLTVPWGDENLDLALPAAWPAPEVAWPDLEGGLDPAAYPDALAAALDAPGVWPGAAIGPGAKVAIVVDDPSRWTPVREALPLLLPRLHDAGVRVEDVSISAGVGRHAAVDDAAMRRRVGEAIVERYACHSPPVDDLSRYVALGTTPEGVPVRVFRPVAEADVRLLIGSVLPHLQAGFGGGLKLIFPGCSHRSTLGALHRQGLSGNAAALLGGDPAQNPMRRAIRHAAAMLSGPNLSINHLLGTPGQVLHVAAGSPDAVQGGLAVEAQRRFRVPAGEPADIVVAGNAPWPGDPMQSFKVLLNHRAAGRPGGVLVGLFWTDPDEIDRSFPLGPMRAIAGSGAVGGWALRRGLAAADTVAAGLNLSASFMIRWARELVVDRTVLVYSPLLRRRLGPCLGPIRLFDALPPLWDAARAALARDRRDAPRLRVFPRGGLTYCPHPDVVPPGPAQNLHVN